MSLASLPTLHTPLPSPLQPGATFRCFQTNRENDSQPPQAASFSATPAAEKKPIHWKNLGLAGLFVLSGLMMKGLPSLHNPKFSIPTDWKVYGKVVMGILAAGQVNKAFNWKPAPWLSALETVGFIFPLTTPVLNGAALGQMAVLGPWVSGVVQLASKLNNVVGDKLEEWHIPKPITKLVVSTLLMVGGVRFFPPVYKAISKTGLLRPFSKEALTGSVAASATATSTCIRGCTPGGVICLSEIGEMLGGMASVHGGARTPSSTRNANQ